MLNHVGCLGAAAAVLALVLVPGSAGAQSPPSGTEGPAPRPTSVTLPPAPPPATPGVDTGPAAKPATPAPLPPAAAPVAAKPWSGWKPAVPKLPPPPPPPDVAARLWLIAPGPHEAWTLRIDNEGERAIRIPADIRLLSFEVEVASPDPKKKKPTIYKCAAPDAMRPASFPERRALLLAPGQSYIESFDPELFCFGKNAPALVGSAIVRTTFGWAPPPKWSLAAKKAPTGPFAAEGVDNPALTTPLRQLTAPTIVLSYGSPPPAAVPAANGPDGSPIAPAPAANGFGGSPNAPAPAANGPGGSPIAPAPAANGFGGSPIAPAPAANGFGGSPNAPATAANGPGGSPNAPATAATAPGEAPIAPAPAAPAPAKPVDANAPRLAVEVSPFIDASAPRNVTVTVTVKNAGGRPMVAALRPRMVAFDVAGPDRVVTCPAAPPTGAIPREGFREYKPQAKTSFTLLLGEVCPGDVFSRPGLYRVTAAIVAQESGAELHVDAFTGKAVTPVPALLRLQTAREPFYPDAPKAVPTPKPKMEDDAGETSP